VFQDVNPDGRCSDERHGHSVAGTRRVMSSLGTGRTRLSIAARSSNTPRPTS
jgi:hypothetical protein